MANIFETDKADFFYVAVYDIPRPRRSKNASNQPEEPERFLGYVQMSAAKNRTFHTTGNPRNAYCCSLATARAIANIIAVDTVRRVEFVPAHKLQELNEISTSDDALVEIGGTRGFA